MMTRPRFWRAMLLVLGAGWAAHPSAWAHDLMASHAKVRIKPDGVEVEIKIAADSAWALVQDSGGPSVAFVLEDFEKVGRPLLMTFARQMEELVSDGQAVRPRKIDVTIVEDNFVFSFAYPRPTGKSVNLKQNYLSRMPEGYMFLAMLLDDNGEALSSAVLHRSDPALEIVVPPHAKPTP